MEATATIYETYVFGVLEKYSESQALGIADLCCRRQGHTSLEDLGSVTIIAT